MSEYYDRIILFNAKEKNFVKNTTVQNKCNIKKDIDSVKLDDDERFSNVKIFLIQIFKEVAMKENLIRKINPGTINL